MSKAHCKSIPEDRLVGMLGRVLSAALGSLLEESFRNVARGARWCESQAKLLMLLRQAHVCVCVCARQNDAPTTKLKRALSNNTHTDEAQEECGIVTSRAIRTVWRTHHRTSAPLEAREKRKQLK